MTLTLSLRARPPARVIANALIPERLHGIDAAGIAAVNVRCGRETVAVGELFEISGTAGEELVLAGNWAGWTGSARGCPVAAWWSRDPAATMSAPG